MEAKGLALLWLFQFLTITSVITRVYYFCISCFEMDYQLHPSYGYLIQKLYPTLGFRFIPL